MYFVFSSTMALVSCCSVWFFLWNYLKAGKYLLLCLMSHIVGTPLLTKRTSAYKVSHSQPVCSFLLFLCWDVMALCTQLLARPLSVAGFSLIHETLLLPWFLWLTSTILSSLLSASLCNVGCVPGQVEICSFCFFTCRVPSCNKTGIPSLWVPSGPIASGAVLSETDAVTSSPFFLRLF